MWKVVTCKHCQSLIEWRRDKGQWKAYNFKFNSVHVCPKYKKEESETKLDESRLIKNPWWEK